MESLNSRLRITFIRSILLQFSYCESDRSFNVFHLINASMIDDSNKAPVNRFYFFMSTVIIALSTGDSNKAPVKSVSYCAYRLNL